MYRIIQIKSLIHQLVVNNKPLSNEIPLEHVTIKIVSYNIEKKNFKESELQNIKKYKKMFFELPSFCFNQHLNKI